EFRNFQSEVENKCWVETFKANWRASVEFRTFQSEVENKCWVETFKARWKPVLGCKTFKTKWRTSIKFQNFQNEVANKIKKWIDLLWKRLDKTTLRNRPSVETAG
ncbi:hypothetical protein A2U01_0060356, partial [Trifolium medium]|nr:hypothetical protein [Trifolium medium]